MFRTIRFAWFIPALLLFMGAFLPTATAQALPAAPSQNAGQAWPHYDPNTHQFAVKTFHLKAELAFLGPDSSAASREVAVFHMLDKDAPVKYFQTPVEGFPVLEALRSNPQINLYLLTIDADWLQDKTLRGKLRQIDTLKPPVSYLVAKAAAASDFVVALPTPTPPPGPVNEVMPTIVYRVPDATAEKQMPITRFSRVMDALGAQIPPQQAQQFARQERTDADAELALIAWDRHQHPQLYQELYDHYRPQFDVLGEKPHPGVSPNLLAKHTTEKYRRVWEYFLVSPLTGANTTAAKALQQIGNDASLTIYKLAYAMTADPQINAEATKPIQQLLLRSMSGFHDHQARLTMLACLPLSQQQMAHQPKTWDPADYVRELSAPQNKPVERKREAP